MRHLFWNCKGLARGLAIRATQALVRQFFPDCLCLVETKIGDPQLDIRRISFQQFLHSPSRGLSGGLVFAWRVGFDFDLLFINHCIIHILVKSDSIVHPWLCTFVYASNLLEEEVAFWDKLSKLGSDWQGPWLVIGDFNMVLSQVEKHGGWLVRTSASTGLSHLVACHGL